MKIFVYEVLMTIHFRLCVGEAKLKPANIKVIPPSLIKVSPDKIKGTYYLNVELQRLMDVIPATVVVGIPTTSRAVVAKDEEKVTYKYIFFYFKCVCTFLKLMMNFI